MNIFYVNGNYLPEDQAVLPVRDLSILRGYGAFDYLRTYGGQPYRLEANLTRLRKSCEILELSLTWSDEELTEIVQETLRRNASNADEFSIRLVITAGVGGNNFSSDGKSTLAVLVQPIKDLPIENYENGVKVISVELHRLFPDAKSTLYTAAILAQKRAKEQGAVEAIYKDTHGNVLEATTANLFAVIGNTIVTPPLEDRNILAGVTRMTILELTQDYFKLDIRSLSYEELLTADEVFLTSANVEVMPVVQVDEHKIGDGIVGEYSRQLLSLFRDKVYKRQSVRGKFA